jgi:hypothetical protein
VLSITKISYILFVFTHCDKYLLSHVGVIPFIKDVIHLQATKYRNMNMNHTNELITALTDVPPVARRLKRQWPEDLLM